MTPIFRLTIMAAIKEINPVAEVTFSGMYAEDLDACEFLWNDNTTPISKADIKTKMDELKAEYDAQDYARKRQAEYPDIYDYMDGIVKNDQTQIDKYIADAQDVKARHPKGG